MNRPNAPTSSILTVIKTFEGEEEIGGTDGWLVTFTTASQFQSALALINMFNGWKATAHPNIKNMIHIEGV